MPSLDPVRLARRQLQLDRERTGHMARLFEHKAERMMASPLALLRGSAPLFYELLERHPVFAEGPPGEGWLVGDAHLENFGAYRPDALSLSGARSELQGERVVFDLNDFDDAFVGPWRYDVLRLTTSLVLGAREVGADGPQTLTLCDALIDAYAGAVFHSKRPPPVPAPVAVLIERARTRTRKELLDARTRFVRDGRRFVRGPRYADLSRGLRERVDKAFAKYVRRLDEAVRPPEAALEIVDAAFRVAGTGSLGCVRVAVLVRGKGGPDGGWIFDMKEEGRPAGAAVVRAPRLEPAERVCAAALACLAHPPRMIGATRLRGCSMFVRRLAPQEDKVNLGTLRTTDLEPLARHFGGLLGAAHRRGAKRFPKRAWRDADRARLLDSAIILAGVHEAVYLAYCDLFRREASARE